MPEKDVKEQVEETVDRFSMMKKAGLPLPLIIVLTVMSTPGFYSWLFDDSSDRAKAEAVEAGKKAEVAYEVLAAEVGELRRDNEQLRGRVQNQYNVLMLLLQKGIGVEGPTEVDVIHEIVNTPVHTEAPPVSRRRARGGGGASEEPETAPMAELVPPEVLEEMVEQNMEPPPEQRKALPKELKGLMR